jgi:hypothetical protein
MTHAITLVKCASGRREDALKIMLDLKRERDLKEKQKAPDRDTVIINECYISFGWPDFVLVLDGDNVELLKKAIVDIRTEVFRRKGGHLETSTIICTTELEIQNAKKKINAVKKN